MNRCLHCGLWGSEPRHLLDSSQVFVCGHTDCETVYYDLLTEELIIQCYFCDRLVECQRLDLTEQQKVLVCWSTPCQVEFSLTRHMLNYEKCPGCFKLYKLCWCMP